MFVKNDPFRIHEPKEKFHSNRENFKALWNVPINIKVEEKGGKDKDVLRKFSHFLNFKDF